MKRIITFLVLLFGVLSSLMAHDAVVDGIYYNLDTTNKTAAVTFRGTSYSEYSDEYSGNVDIPETIVYKDVLYSVTYINSYAFCVCKNLTSVVIGNNVTGINTSAFSGCSALSSVTIGSAVTSIGDYAFNECRILDDIVIPENVTHIGNYAFRECDKLSSINIPNSGYNASFNGIFSGCENLKEVILPSKMTGIGQYVFSGCSALTSITLSENIKSIGSYAFAGCTGITSVTLPKSVNTIGANAFENCTGLTTLEIGSGVTSIGEKAFNGCSSLESVTSYATTVPAVSTNSFSNFIAYLYVPCASKIDYDLDATFGQFKYIECVTEDEGGDDNGNDDTGGDDTSDDNTNDDNTDDTVTPTVFDVTTDQGVAFVVNPNSANPVYVPLTYSYNAEFQTAQYTGTYTVTDLDFTAKIGGLTNLDVINFGTNGQALEANYLYNPTRGASNGFTITGDYKVGDILNINATFDSDWNVILIIDVTKILEPTPNDITLYYVNSNEWDTVNGYVWPTGGAGLLEWPGAPATKIDKTVDGFDVYSYTFDSTKADNIIFNAGSGGAQTKDLAVNAAKPYYYNGVWYETLTFDGEQGGDDTDPIVPETSAYVVRGNGGSDATGIWCGGIEWTADDSPVNNMTDADADGIYEVTYKNVPAGTWNFKVVGTTEGWMGSDYLDTENSSAGCTTAPYDGNIGFTLNAPADVTIKFNTLTGKIIATTPSGSFGKVVIEHFHILTGNNQCLDELEFTEANNYTLVLTQEVIIDEEYGVAYVGCGILGNCDYAVYEKYFSIEVTENGTYTVTVQFNGDYENPDFTVTAVKQGGSDEPVVPDPVISDITEPTFPQTEVGKASTATVTYTLENATSATVSIESEGEEAFFIQSQSVVNGKGSVSIMFMPETKGVHAATLVIKSGKVTETLRILAKAVDPAPEVLPIISDIDVPAFADTYLNATNVVTATYSLANATEATATISGANADAFYILSQSVGSVKILFMPEAEGTYNAILTITSGKTSESVNFTAKAIEFIPEPEPAISNVNVPAFATIEIGSAANVTATFTLENATEVSATLSGTGADAFILGQPMVNNGNGSIKIAFVPTEAGTYTATLTLKSGKAVHTATITAVATEPAPQVRIENIQVPVFEEVYLGGYASVNVTYTLVNATKATVTVTGDVFTTGNNSVVGGIGTVPVDFMPETAGVHTATLTITAGGVSESVTLVAIAKLKSTDEPSGKVTISNLQVPEFASITAKEATTVTASYVVTGSTAATATLSGTDAAYFTILSQTLSEGVGQVEIAFAPTVAREYNATMVVTSGGVTESINFAATASEAPSILGLHVNDFGTVYVGEKVTVMANYSLAYAETATATLSGDTDVFAISRQMVSDGNGLVRIDFTPIAAGTYHATLTIKSGVSEESIDFSATAIKYEEPVIEPVISNLIVPEFGEVLIGETVQKIATYTLENATEATATLSGDKAFTITRTLNGAVRIMFAPTAAGTYNATLTITSGTVSESISFSATAVKDEEPEIEPIISNLMVPEFGEVLIGETVQRIATYTLENATEATATLSGDAVFTITRSQNGLVRIKFAPTEAGTYNGTLTITSGKVSESINFSAIAIEEGSDNPDNPDTPDNPDMPDNPDTPVDPEDPDTPVVPDPLPEYPVRGYMYVVNTPDAELEKMVKYKPVSIDKVDYFLAPEKTGQKIYGYDIYKFEVRDEEMIDLWEYPNAQYTSWHIDVNVDLSATPYLANGVWYASIEEMMTWYVRYIPQWDDEASEKMIVESPNVYVATFDAFAESDDNDKYYYCLGNVEDPILEVGVSEYGVIQNYLQIPQGFKAMIYLDDTNWETEWKTYYKLVPPGKDWNRDCIDLGLSSGLCWATKNLGATEPQQEGTHFAWGEVEPKEEYSYNTYKWANLLKNNEYIKYVTDDYWGTIIDFRTTLEPTDDAANVALEGKWHMPTQADVEELLRECTTEFGSYYGVNGYFVTGPNGNAIFLPAVGIKEGTGYEESTRGGDYWTSSLYEDNQAYAVTLSFSLTYIDVDDMKRTNGLAIRPVIHRDYVGIEEVVAINVYAKDHTIYCEEPFQIYTVTGLEVTHLNGALEGVYIVKTENGNKLISVW
ncbi:MAG: leucine-rich repeat protein [Paludibacteraceae bacterium]|nr:leucine-rich repeat protein [Paludibacteraceae bacterium]